MGKKKLRVDFFQYEKDNLLMLIYQILCHFKLDQRTIYQIGLTPLFLDG
jgi:hypothetical protein